jgi:mannose-6-phosphate isomerase
MTIAVTPFDGFCGFRPLGEIASFLQYVPQLRELVSDEKATAFLDTVAGKEDSSDPQTVSANKEALKSLFEALMTSPEDKIKSLSKALVASAESNPEGFAGAQHGGPEYAELIKRLNSQFPEDIGLFCSFFLNYVKLQPGEAMFLQANDPHAYLSGGM